MGTSEMNHRKFYVHSDSWSLRGVSSFGGISIAAMQHYCKTNVAGPDKVDMRWPPSTDLTGLPANGGFYFQAFNEMNPLLDITTAVTGLLC